MAGFGADIEELTEFLSEDLDWNSDAFTFLEYAEDDKNILPAVSNSR